MMISFTTIAWYDYCNMCKSDPRMTELIEKVLNSLSDKVNQPDKSGVCHASGARFSIDYEVTIDSLIVRDIKLVNSSETGIYGYRGKTVRNVKKKTQRRASSGY